MLPFERWRPAIDALEHHRVPTGCSLQHAEKIIVDVSRVDGGKQGSSTERKGRSPDGRSVRSPVGAFFLWVWGVVRDGPYFCC
jgi:hypothetical protein